MKTVPPTTAEGIERYLGSGLVKGIGPILAKKLVGRFGAEVLAVIENRAAELQTVDGIGPKRRERIAHAWQEAKQVREIMLFLHSHGVSTSRAVRIFKTYGEQAIEKVRSNPYMLAKDIYGIGFATADQIAQKVGIPEDSLNRARAGIDHVLLEATSDGHCALPLEKLKLAAVKLLEVPEGTVEQALSQMLTSGSLLLEEIDGEPLIFLPHLRRAEEGIAARIKSLAEAEPIYPPIDFEKAVAWCEQRTGKTLAPSQREALKTVLANRVVVITGGPGVGKTTLVNSILMILRAKGVKCLLCAPTGRAAKRLTETTGLEAKTIHRLLEIDPATGRFSRNESNPLACGLLVVDETSMVDVPLMHSLVRAVPNRAGLVLVGDVDQLPSVGPGTVLAGLDRERGRASRAPHRSIQAGGGQPHHHQRAPHPPRADAGHAGSRPEFRFPFRRAGRAGEDRGNAGQAGAGEDSRTVSSRPDPRRSGSLPDEPGIARRAGTEHSLAAGIEPSPTRSARRGAVRMAIPDRRQGHPDGERLRQGGVQRRHRDRRADRSGRAAGRGALRRPAGQVRLRGIGRGFAGLRDHDPQVAGIGVPGSGDPAGHAALHAAAT